MTPHLCHPALFIWSHRILFSFLEFIFTISNLSFILKAIIFCPSPTLKYNNFKYKDSNASCHHCVPSEPSTVSALQIAGNNKHLLNERTLVIIIVPVLQMKKLKRKKFNLIKVIQLTRCQDLILHLTPKPLSY